MAVTQERGQSTPARLEPKAAGHLLGMSWQEARPGNDKVVH